jgi:hypothetical protein
MSKDEGVNRVPDVDVVANRLFAHRLQSRKVVLVGQRQKVGGAVAGLCALGLVCVDETKKLKKREIKNL